MSLQQKLLEEKGKRGCIFITRLEELVTLSSVEQFLSCYFDKSSTPVPPPADLHEIIVPSSRKVFAVLVLAGLEKWILDFFVVRRITDKIFPASDSDVMHSPGTAEERHRFLKEQWTIPPILSAERHLDFPLGTILPFLGKKFADHGSFGRLYKVRVAEGHLHSKEPRYAAVGLSMLFHHYTPSLFLYFCRKYPGFDRS
jgi:hypothetical protein